MSKASEIIDTIISKGLEIDLINNGYKKRNHNFYLASTDCIKLVNIQLGRFNYGEYGYFTLNLGIYIREIEELKDWGKVTKYPKDYECTIVERIGSLMPEGTDKWWNISSKTNIEDLSEEIKAVWLKYGKPWIDYYGNRKNLKELFLNEEKFVMASALCLVNGELEEAKKLIYKNYERPENGEISETWQGFIDRIVNTLGIKDLKK